MQLMNKFEETLDKSRNGRIVRWPFRALATVFLFAALFVFFTASYLGFIAGNHKMALIAIVTLPLATLLSRLVGYIVLKGRVLSNPFWPFASGAVTLVWIVLFLLAVLYYA